MENRDIINDEINNDLENSYNNYTPYVSEQEQINLMIEALFYKFFNGIDVELWQNDLEQVEFTDEADADDIAYFTALNRINNKVKSYVIEKKD